MGLRNTTESVGMSTVRFHAYPGDFSRGIIVDEGGGVECDGRGEGRAVSIVVDRDSRLTRRSTLFSESAADSKPAGDTPRAKRKAILSSL